MVGSDRTPPVADRDSKLAGGCVPTVADHASTPGQQPLALQNRAGSSKSPFVFGMRHSPVHWQLLDAQSVEHARRENKLVFLTVGYQACHFCRLMNTESFSNPECAAILNQQFIPILIDREQRPDIDAIYMNYVQAVNNCGGWPLNLFLTPELEPIFGGTYWPGPASSRRSPNIGSGPGPGSMEQEDAMPDFLTILKKVAGIWADKEAICRKEATEVLAQLREFAAEGTLGTRGLTTPSMMAPSAFAASLPTEPPPPVREKDSFSSSELDLDQLEEAYTHIAGTFDPVCGGFGLAPKFLTPPKLHFLLRLAEPPRAIQDVVGESDCKHATEMVLLTLRKIRDGALRDHVGGQGFARCSVTPDWTIPNFEKLMVDNALLLTVYLKAWLIRGATTKSEFFDVVIELVDYLTQAPIVLPAGGFASSEAADSLSRRGNGEMREGAYYLWTRREFDSVLAVAGDNISPVAAAYWDVREDGNVDEDHDPNDDFINHNILRIVRTPQELGQQFGISPETAMHYIDLAKRELKARRDRDRVRPGLDDKLVAGWNGLAISALSQAAAALKEASGARSDKCLETARAAIAFIRRQLWDEDGALLYRVWRQGRETEAFAEDYAYLILGLLDFAHVSGDEEAIDWADSLQGTQISLFHDPAGGFFTTTASSPQTILRLKDGMDTSLPSVNAVSASNLFRLSARLGNDHYAALARRTVNVFEAEMLQHPWLFPSLLSAVVTARLGLQPHRLGF